MFKCYSRANPTTTLAVKVTREDDEEKKRAIRAEFEITKDLRHPNIISTREIFENEIYSEIHLVMEYAEGKELSPLLVEYSLAPSDILKIMKQILGALSYLHDEKGVVHRDLKPSNIIINTEGTIFLLDFNVSRRQSEGSLMLTRTGTPHFNAPEIYLNQPYTNKIDIWSAGVIFYFMLTKSLPFPEENVAVLI